MFQILILKQLTLYIYIYIYIYIYTELFLNALTSIKEDC